MSASTTAVASITTAATTASTTPAITAAQATYQKDLAAYQAAAADAAQKQTALATAQATYNAASTTECQAQAAHAALLKSIADSALAKVQGLQAKAAAAAQAKNQVKIINQRAALEVPAPPAPQNSTCVIS